MLHHAPKIHVYPILYLDVIFDLIVIIILKKILLSVLYYKIFFFLQCLVRATTLPLKHIRFFLPLLSHKVWSHGVLSHWQHSHNEATQFRSIDSTGSACLWFSLTCDPFPHQTLWLLPPGSWKGPPTGKQGPLGFHSLAPQIHPPQSLLLASQPLQMHCLPEK